MFEVHILAYKHELHAQELNPTFAKPQRVLNKRMKREKERSKMSKKEMIKGPYFPTFVCVRERERERERFFENTGEREAHLFCLKL